MAYDIAALPSELDRLTSVSVTADDAKALARGLSIDAVEELTRRIAPEDANLKHRLIPKATYARRKSAGQRLTIEESERVVRLARVWNFAEYVFGKDWKTRRFLTDPHWLLDERTPLDLILESEVGAKVVEQLLGQALHGIAL